MTQGKIVGNMWKKVEAEERAPFEEQARPSSTIQQPWQVETGGLSSFACMQFQAAVLKKEYLQPLGRTWLQMERCGYVRCKRVGWL